jgi:hypothetical protein
MAHEEITIVNGSVLRDPDLRPSPRHGSRNSIPICL